VRIRPIVSDIERKLFKHLVLVGGGDVHRVVEELLVGQRGEGLEQRRVGGLPGLRRGELLR
jgi:hypothetical protein